MCIAEIPKLLFYAYIPSIILGIFFGTFIYLQNKKGTLNILLATISFVFSAYATVDFLTWFPWSYETYLLFQKVLLLTLVILPLFLYLALHLSEARVTRLKHVLIWIPLLPVFFLTFSKYNSLIFSIKIEKMNCIVAEGPFYGYVYLLSIIYLLIFVSILIYKFKENKNSDIIKKRIKIVTFASAFFIIWFSLLIKLQDYFGEDPLVFIPLGMVLFVGILGYGITKYKLFNIKLLTAQALTVALMMLIGSELFFVESLMNKILVSTTLLIAIGMGWILVRSVKLENKRKEELQAMSDKLSGANDRLRTLDNAKSEFISIASHQLRTPLTAIKGFVSLLLEDSYGKLEEKQKDVLRKVYVSNDRLVTLVEDLLNISRIESGRMEFKLTAWKVENICQEVMDTFIPKAKDLGLYLDYKKPETDLPEVMIDGIKVREVVSNMVDNALKYTPKGGVTVRVEQDEISLYTPDKNADKEDDGLVGPVVRVIVSDTGIGVPVTELPYLFAKFSRGKDISRLNTGGTGLGLYVGRAMIENNGGRIWAESAGEGAGSRFLIEIPVNQSKELLERWG